MRAGDGGGLGGWLSENLAKEQHGDCSGYRWQIGR
jgi:hypothetical protein